MLRANVLFFVETHVSPSHRFLLAAKHLGIDNPFIGLHWRLFFRSNIFTVYCQNLQVHGKRYAYRFDFQGLAQATQPQGPSTSLGVSPSSLDSVSGMVASSMGMSSSSVGAMGTAVGSVASAAAHHSAGYHLPSRYHQYHQAPGSMTAAHSELFGQSASSYHAAAHAKLHFNSASSIFAPNYWSTNGSELYYGLNNNHNGNIIILKLQLYLMGQLHQKQ